MADPIDRAWPRLLAQAHDGKAPERAGHEPDELAECYQAFLAPRPDGICVLAHLGQSLDGCIATASGHSACVTGHENIVHLHRLRALADAVLVGAGTVAHDDPRLTTRHVEGPSPLRVVLDPDRRLNGSFGLFREGPNTLVLCRATAIGEQPRGVTTVEHLDHWSPDTILRHLRDRGIRRLFIEGGGVTVSQFVAAGCVDLLHICISPVLIGKGRRGLSGPAIESMDQALRPQTNVVRMGNDRLFASKLTRRRLDL